MTGFLSRRTIGSAWKDLARMQSGNDDSPLGSVVPTGGTLCSQSVWSEGHMIDSFANRSTLIVGDLAHCWWSVRTGDQRAESLIRK